MTHFWFVRHCAPAPSVRGRENPVVPHEYLTVAQLVERGTVNVYSGDP